MKKARFLKLVAFTIVLDGEPFIERHLPVFQQLTIPWHWIVVEGAAGNTADTAWCTKQEPRVSHDGTVQYLSSIMKCKGVTVLANPWWENKTAMCNAALSEIKEPCVLMQIDADEIWTAEQLEKIVWLFEQNAADLGSIMFACHYFVGPDLMLRGGNCYGDYDYEWIRAWRFNPGDKFASHEPPLLCQYGPAVGARMTKALSRTLGLIFDHFPYVTEAQVKFKQDFYGYAGLLSQWKALQAQKDFPVPLSRFFAHVSGELPLVVKI